MIMSYIIATQNVMDNYYLNIIIINCKFFYSVLAEGVFLRIVKSKYSI